MAEAKEVKTKSGGTQFRPNLDSDEEYMELADDWGGFWILCGEFTTGVEPDARMYECSSCGEKGVYGLEELMMAGAVYLEGERWRM